MATEFQELVDKHYQALYKFAYSLAKSPERAGDLVQETFCIWAQKNHQLKDRSKAKTWLFTTLYREHISHARRSGKFPEQDIADVEFQLTDGGVDNGRVLDAQRAVKLLKSLDDNYQAPLTLFFIQQHAYKEIAEILDIPIGTVMSRIARGKKQLRDKMETEAIENKVVSMKQAN